MIVGFLFEVVKGFILWMVLREWLYPLTKRWLVKESNKYTAIWKHEFMGHQNQLGQCVEGRCQVFVS